MSGKRISELTELNEVAQEDFLPIVDDSETDLDEKTKKVTYDTFRSAILQGQFYSHHFKMNGRYGQIKGRESSDGFFPILFNIKIVGISIFIKKAGVSGKTEIDLEWFSSNGTNEGSLLFTKPAMEPDSGDNAYIIYNAISDQNVAFPSLGATAPVLTKTEFAAGDSIVCKIDDAMIGSRDLDVQIHYIPMI